MTESTPTNGTATVAAATTNGNGHTPDANAPAPNVLKEYGRVGRYHIRLIESRYGPPVLDIREYIRDPRSGYEGFTKRGIRLSMPSDVARLAGILSRALVPEGAASPSGNGHPAPAALAAAEAAAKEASTR